MDDSKSKRFAERWGPIYSEALKRIDRLNRKHAIAMSVMDDVDKQYKEIPQHTKGMVRYEMAIRQDIEKHKVLDVLFAQESSVLDRLSSDGKKVPCQKCKGKGISNMCVVCSGNKEILNSAGNMVVCSACNGLGGGRCSDCGGVGKMVDHDLSLKFKILASMGNVNRNLQMMMQGSPPVDEIPPEMLEGIFEQLRRSGLRGKEAEDALKGMVQAIPGFTPEMLSDFMRGYEEYCKSKDGMDETDVKGEKEEGSG